MEAASTVPFAARYDADDDEERLLSLQTPLHVITPTLCIGAVFARSPKLLDRYGITTIVSIMQARDHEEEKKYPLPPHVFEHRLYLDDVATPHFTPVLEEAVRVLHERRDTVRLVHCGAGISRSAAVCIGYLMFSQRMRAQEAYTVVERARPCINPNRDFQRQLCDYERKLGLV